jgi:4-amino-4-deoxy-L-arabinose transferase-like glycosyltransferase
MTKALSCILLLTFIILIPGMSERAFITRGEAREALVMQSIVRDGAWILPQGYSETIPSKPPLLHWLAAGASLITGEVTEFSARIPSALAAATTLLALFLFVHYRLGLSYAWWSCLVLLTSFEFLRAGSIARVDMVLTATFTLGVIALFRWYEANLKKIPLSVIAAFTAATYAKGPVAIVLPAMLFALFLVIRQKSLASIVTASLKVWLPTVILASAWYIAAHLHGGERFFEKVWYENVQRMSGTMEDEPHKHSIFYLLGVLFMGLAPWSILCGAQCRLRWSSTALRAQFERFKSSPALWQFTWIFALGITLFFCIPSSKRGVYLLPAYPWYALLVSTLVIHNVPGRVSRYFVITSAALFSVLGVAGIGVATGITSLEVFLSSARFTKVLPYYRELLSGMYYGALWFWSIAACGIAVYAYGKRATRYAPVLVTLFGALFVNVGLLVPLNNAVSPQQFAQETIATLPPDKKLFSFATEFYGVAFYSHRQIYRTELFEAHPGDLILVYDDDLEKLKKRYNVVVRTQSSNPIGEVDRIIIVTEVVS